MIRALPPRACLALLLAVLVPGACAATPPASVPQPSGAAPAGEPSATGLDGGPVQVRPAPF